MSGPTDPRETRRSLLPPPLEGMPDNPPQAVPPPAGPPSGKRTATLSPMDPPERPDEIGRLGGYRILRIIGHGGMGVVYEAEDPQLRRKVAIKCLLSEVALRPGNKERFLREARATAAVDHDNVVNIHQVGTDHDVPFIVMPLLQGGTLKKRLEAEKCLPLGEVVRIAREICYGLRAAHEKGLIHRDIKPENIWLEGKKGRVRILDFGLARVNDDAEMRSQGGQLVGTPGYISPEQIAGEEVDERADLFSLGCLLYEMSTGQPPFSGANFLALLTNVTTQTPQDPNKINPQLPGVLSALILKLIEKLKENRPRNVDEVLAVLDFFEPTPASSTGQVTMGTGGTVAADSSPFARTQEYDREKLAQQQKEMVEEKHWSEVQNAKTLKQTVPPPPPPAPPPSKLLPMLLAGGVMVLFAVVGLVLAFWKMSGDGTSPTSGNTQPSSLPSVAPPTVAPPTTKPTQAPPTTKPTQALPTVAPPTVSPPTVPPKKPTTEELYAEALKLLKANDYSRAFIKFEHLADQGHAPSRFQVGYSYFYGLGRKIDRLAAIQQFKVGESLKDPRSALALGLSECEGMNQPRNLSRGEARIKQSLAAIQKAAETGDTQAMVLLGDALLDGYGVTQDREAAAAWFRKAAVALDPHGLIRLANCYKEGWGVVADDETRLSLLKQARDRKFPVSYAHLADFHREGKLNPVNLPEAAKLYQEAADAGFAPARLRQASALNDLKKEAEAAAAYSQAIDELLPWGESGDIRAQYDLGVLYIRDNKLPNHQKHAFDWFSKAAQQDHAMSQYRLGQFYLNGWGVQMNPNQARIWFKKAADQGNKQAEMALKQLGM